MMRIKHCVTLIGASLLMNIVGTQSVIGQPVLDKIEYNTAQTATNTEQTTTLTTSMNFYLTQILAAVNGIPAYIMAMGEYIHSVTDPIEKDNKVLNDMEKSIAQLGEFIIQSQTDNQSTLPGLNNTLLLSDDKKVLNANEGKKSVGTLPTKTTFWYANDLLYSSLLGIPYYNPDPRTQAGEKPFDFAANYVKNASGINISHVIPDPSWEDSDAKTRYQNYFNTAMAVSSFNAYVMSKQAAEVGKLNKLQTTLVNQATDPANWIAKVATEKVSFILRQLLLYQSQIFVLLTQMLQLQNQMVTAQVMTNSILIASNQLTEITMVANAQQVQPTAD